MHYGDGRMCVRVCCGAARRLFAVVCARAGTVPNLRAGAHPLRRAAKVTVKCEDVVCVCLCVGGDSAGRRRCDCNPGPAQQQQVPGGAGEEEKYAERSVHTCSMTQESPARAASAALSLCYARHNKSSTRAPPSETVPPSSPCRHSLTAGRGPLQRLGVHAKPGSALARHPWVWTVPQGLRQHFGPARESGREHLRRAPSPRPSRLTPSPLPRAPGVHKGGPECTRGHSYVRPIAVTLAAALQPSKIVEPTRSLP